MGCKVAERGGRRGSFMWKIGTIKEIYINKQTLFKFYFTMVSLYHYKNYKNYELLNFILEITKRMHSMRVN